MLLALSAAALSHINVVVRRGTDGSYAAEQLASLTEPQLPHGVPEETYGPAAEDFDGVISIAGPLSLQPDDLYYEESLMLKRPLQMFADWIHSRGGVFAAGRRYGVRFTWVGDGSSALQVTNATARAIRNSGASFAFSGYSSGLSFYAAQQTAAEGLLMLSAGSASTSIYRQNNLTFGLYPPAGMYTESGLAAIAAAARLLDARATSSELGRMPLPPCFGGASCMASLRAGFVQADNLFTREQCAASPAAARRLGLETVSLPPVTLPLAPSGEQAAAALQQLRQAGATVLVGCTYHAAALAIISALERLDWMPYAVLLSETVDLPSFTSRVATGWWQGEYVLGPTPWASSLPTHGAFSGLSSSEFAEMFRKRFDGSEVSYNGAAQFAAACALAAAIEAANSTEPAAVATQLRGLGIDEFYGRLAFGTDRQISSAGLLVVQHHSPGGSLKVVHSPTGLPTTGELQFPCPPWAQRRCRVLGPQANASTPAGPRVVECSGHGVCNLAGECECEAGYEGVACARSLLQACAAGHERNPDPAAPEHCRPCETGMWKSLASNAACAPCPALSTTPAAGATSRSLCECLPGFYAAALLSADGFECRKCSGFECPRAGTTLATITLRPGSWRLSARTAHIVSCSRGANGTTPCRGGQSAAAGYCSEHHSGARCEVCSAGGQYFSSRLGRCTACPAASSTLGVVRSLAMVAVAIGLSYFLYPSLVRLLPTALAVRLARTTVALWRQVRALATALDLKPKFKIAFAFYQMLAVFPSAYQVTLPDRYAQQTHLFSWLELDRLALLRPTACYPAGLVSKLLREALLPFALLAAVLLSGYVRGRVQRAPAPMTVGLPAALFILFLAAARIIPKVSSYVFAAWDCAAYVYDDAADVVHLQLRADPAVRCSDPSFSSEKHKEVVQTAFPLLWLWPIGAPSFFIVLLLRCRDDILVGRRSSLARATSFLHEDYKPHLFFWEPVETARRLCVTGFVLLVQDAQHRLYLAAMLSAAFAMLIAYLRPYVKPINNLLALGAQLATLSTFVAGIMVRLFSGAEKGFGGDRQQLQRVFGFDSNTSIVNAMLAFNVGFLGLLAVASLYQAVHTDRDDGAHMRRPSPRQALADDAHPLMGVELEPESGSEPAPSNAGSCA